MLRTILHYTLIIIMIGFMACSGDDDTLPPPPPDPEDCDALALSTVSAFPFDTVFLENLPAGFRMGTTVEFLASGQNTGAFMSLEETTDGAIFILAPVHPLNPLSDGVVDVQLRNDNASISCDPLSLNIVALPEASDYTQDVADALQALLLQRLDFLGIDLNTLQGDLAELTDAEMPFAFLYNILNNAESEISYQQFISNDYLLAENDLDKMQSVDLSNRILKRFNALDIIQEDIDSFEERIEGIASDGTTIKNNCGLSAAQVAKEMRIAADAEKYLRSDTPEGMRFQNTSDGVLATGVVPGLGTAAALTGVTLFLYKKIYEGVFNTYVSEFTRIEFKIDKSTLYEETACNNIPYTDVNVYVANKGWELDRSIWESIVQIGGLLASRINWATKLESVPFDASLAFSSKQIDNLAGQGYLDGDRFKVDQKECGPIDMTDPKYIYGKITGNAFTVDQDAMQVIPQRAGIATLEVGVRSLEFGGKTVAATTDLSIKQIQLGWEPTGIFRVTPGEEFDARVNMFNVFKKDLMIEAEEGAVQSLGFEDTGIPFEGIQNYKIFTPTDESKYPYSIIATHTSKECLRGKGDAEPRFTIFTIDAGITVDVFSLETGCLATGETRDFDAIVTGENKDVTWQALNESGGMVNISNTGLFMAPDNPGVYFIIATSVADNTASDTLAVEVGPCLCNWDLTLGQQAFSGDDVNFDRVTVTDKVSMLFTDESDLTKTITIQFDRNNMPQDGASTQFALTQEQKDWLIGGNFNGVTIIGPAPEDSDGNPEPGAASASVDLSLNGTRLEGRISGSIVRLEVVGQEVNQEIVSIDLRFSAEELDPSRQLWGCD